MPELMNRDEEKLEQKPEAPVKSEPGKDQEPEKGPDSTAVDEHGEPLSDEFDRGSPGVRKQPLYRRPAFLIVVKRARSGVAGATAAAAAEHRRTNQAAAGVSAAQANVDQAIAQLSAAEAEAVRADKDVQRYQVLYSKDEVSRQRLDEAIAAARTADARVEAEKRRVASMEAQVGEARANESAQAANAQRARTQIMGAQAQVSEALGRLAQANTAPQQVAVSESEGCPASARKDCLR